MIRTNPENNKLGVLFDDADFTGKNVLEIGYGDGRPTWFYTGQAARVTETDCLIYLPTSITWYILLMEHSNNIKMGRRK